VATRAPSDELERFLLLVLALLVILAAGITAFSCWPRTHVRVVNGAELPQASAAPSADRAAHRLR
jgi:hypothetical protein